MGIKLSRPRMIEVGRIRMGVRDWDRPYKDKNGDTRYPPKKLGYFLITKGKDKDGRPIKDEAVHKVVGDKPTELNVLLPFDSIEANLKSELAAYKAGQKVCHGDGENALRIVDGKWVDVKSLNPPVQCPCPFLEKKLCKPDIKLICFMEKVQGIGGVYCLRSTSWNTLNYLEGSMMSIIGAGLPLSMVPLILSVVPQTMYPGGKETVNYVAYLRSEENTERLWEIAHKRMEMVRLMGPLAMKRLRAMQERAQVAVEVPDEDEEEFAEEFHPEGFLPEGGKPKPAKMYQIGVGVVAPAAPPASPAPPAAPTLPVPQAPAPAATTAQPVAQPAPPAAPAAPVATAAAPAPAKPAPAPAPPADAAAVLFDSGDDPF